MSNSETNDQKVADKSTLYDELFAAAGAVLSIVTEVILRSRRIRNKTI